MARRNLPPLNALRAFEAFARQGRMTAAAEELCVTHGAISRQIKLLESAMGQRLVEGPRNRLKLTAPGLRLAESLTQAFDLIEQAAPAPAAGALHVSCLGTLAMRWLIPRLPRFLEREPRTQVRITESHRPVDFRADDVDLALRVWPNPFAWPAEAEITPFLDHAHGPVLSPELMGSDPPSPAELARLPRLHTRSYMPAWSEWAAQMGIELGPAAVDREFDHTFYMLEAAIAGLGVAISPEIYVAKELAQGRLVAPFGFVQTSVRYAVLLPREGARPAARRFRDWLAEEGATSGRGTASA